MNRCSCIPAACPVANQANPATTAAAAAAATPTRANTATATVTTTTAATAAALNFGDSQGEVLDYVFHNDAQFVLYNADDLNVGWRKGWSCRTLSHPAQPGVTEMILDCVAKWRYGKVTCAACNASCPAPPPSPPTSTSPPPPPPPGCTVFLTFGSVDIEWNLGYKRDFKKQTVDSAAYVAGMAHSLATTAQRIINLNSTENRTTLATAAATSSPADASSSAPAPGNTGAAQQHAASFSDTNDSRHGIDVVVVFPTMPLPLSSDYLEVRRTREIHYPSPHRHCVNARTLVGRHGPLLTGSSTAHRHQGPPVVCLRAATFMLTCSNFDAVTSFSRQ